MTDTPKDRYERNRQMFLDRQRDYYARHEEDMAARAHRTKVTPEQYLENREKFQAAKRAYWERQRRGGSGT